MCCVVVVVYANGGVARIIFHNGLLFATLPSTDVQTQIADLQT